MSNVEESCHEMAEELREVVGWCSGGGLTAEQFRSFVAEFETRKLARHGFELSSAVSADGLVHFTLRQATNGELCASLDVDCKTGASEIQHTTA